MHRKNDTANFDMIQIFFDCITTLLAYFLSQGIYTFFRGVVLDLSHIWMCVIFTVIFVLCMFIMRMYNITTFYYINRIIKSVLVSTCVSASCIGTMILLSKLVTTSRLFFFIFSGLGSALIIVQRLLVRWILREHIGNGYTHVMFVGDDATLERYMSYVSKTSMKIKVDCHLYYTSSELDCSRDFEESLKRGSVDEVLFVCPDASRDPRITGLMNICDEMGITVRLLLDFLDLPDSKRFVSSIGTYPVLTYHSVSFDKVSLFLKSALDIVGASVGLVLFSPLFIATAIAIKIESPGPVFFKQTRIGRNGKPFKMYKFRSMYKDAEDRKQALMSQNQVKGGYMFKMDKDPRVTKVGAFIRKTSIDELPQLLNVLMHNMSLVGTRPPTPDEVDKYDRKHWRRISIKPGITGMWQTSGRSDILDFEEVVALDKKYIDEWSLALDIKLILKTASAVMKRRGAR